MGVVGPQVDLTYPYSYLGEGADALAQLNKGGKFAELLAKASKPAVVVGPGILKRADRDAVLQQVKTCSTTVCLIRCWNHILGSSTFVVHNINLSMW